MILSKAIAILVCTLALVSVIQNAEAGCPFDDGSCQEYCGQQGCNLGYCGHFAWIQCICRKCGDEWNWYDKVHYNPDKQVNQTELDSLKLNGSAPLILTNNNAKRSETPTPAPQQVPAGKVQPPKAATVEQKMQPAAPVTAVPQAKQPEQKVAATLTTLLIPDLSDGSRLDLNDIPDENSEKFLDYLTKNHEKLVQATNTAQQKLAASSARSADGDNENKDDDETDIDEAEAEQQVTTSSTNQDGEAQADEAVEIQISSSNNNQPSGPQTSTTTNKSSRPTASGEPQEDEQQTSGGATTRLLRMAVAGRSPDDIF